MTIKKCENCEFRDGGFTDYGRCARTGEFMTIQRRYPKAACDQDFSGWVQKRSLRRRIIDRIKGWFE